MRDWDAVAFMEDGMPITWRELVAEEIARLSPLAKEYLSGGIGGPLRGRAETQGKSR
jgi:hypothetical protein